jgi:hypothetical protein
MPRSPTRPGHITVGRDPNLVALMESIRARDTTSADHAIHRAALRVGLTLFAKSPESLAAALVREHHKLPLEGDDLNERTVKELAKALQLATRRAS